MKMPMFTKQIIYKWVNDHRVVENPGKLPTSGDFSGTSQLASKGQLLGLS